jgi:hypothetical protein
MSVVRLEWSGRLDLLGPRGRGTAGWSAIAGSLLLPLFAERVSVHPSAWFYDPLGKLVRIAGARAAPVGLLPRFLLFFGHAGIIRRSGPTGKTNRELPLRVVDG